MLWGHRRHPGLGFQSQLTSNRGYILLWKEVQPQRESNTFTQLTRAQQTHQHLSRGSIQNHGPRLPRSMGVSNLLPCGGHNESMLNFLFSFVSRWGLVQKQWWNTWPFPEVAFPHGVSHLRKMNPDPSLGNSWFRSGSVSWHLTSPRPAG